MNVQSVKFLFSINKTNSKNFNVKVYCNIAFLQLFSAYILCYRDNTFKVKVNIKSIKRI